MSEFSAHTRQEDSVRMPDAEAPPRPLRDRKADALSRLADDGDLWLATAGTDRIPCVVPLSFWWDGDTIYFATLGRNPTSLNIDGGGPARVILGHTRDVVLIDGRALRLSHEEADQLCADKYAVKTGWDPRDSKGYVFFRFSFERVESWRELNEHADRVLMSDGTWTV